MEGMAGEECCLKWQLRRIGLNGGHVIISITLAMGV